MFKNLNTVLQTFLDKNKYSYMLEGIKWFFFFLFDHNSMMYKIF